MTVSQVQMLGTHLPEALGNILAGATLEDLWATGVLISKLGHIVDAAVNDDPQLAVGLGVGDFLCGEGLGHGDGGGKMTREECDGRCWKGVESEEQEQ